ncbi:hypothetical protein GCM10011491_41360 [Brucella endophytica]|uniref:Uncharacterized protein n=1 Tax=Brucella endophytica TaxID=1963359 RepID=A0A916SNP9_9HYPH|nr:hypothetical protein [Brucella endophytica]GGB09131.1 hypothetical protein GCM10011491_41360 [Brucella endophytica]
MSQPLCRYCGKKIAKKTETIYFGPEAAAHVTDFASSRPEYPTSKEEVQRLVNGQVVGVSWSRGEDYYAKKAGCDFIFKASTWDGESYQDPFFCNGEHAKRFAYALARAGHATQAYQKANEAALANSSN